MGHTAWLIPDIAAMDRLMLGALGMTLREEISAPNVQGHFYGCNPRHHSLAAFGDRQLHLEHVMVEMNELDRSEEHTSELQSLMRISYAVFCLKKKKQVNNEHKNKNKKKRTTNNNGKDNMTHNMTH